MNIVQFNRAMDLQRDIYDCQKNYERAAYTQGENVAIRKTYLRVNGLEEEIEVPETLFRIIGKLVMAEYDEKCNRLQKEFDAL